MSYEHKLLDKNKIKLVVLFVLFNANRAITRDTLTEIFIDADIVDLFVYNEVVTELLDNKLIEETIISVTPHYRVTLKGFETLESLETDIPEVIRQTAVKSTLEVLAKVRLDSQILTSLENVKNGVMVNCKVLEYNSTILSVDLLVANEEQALNAVKNFKENTQHIYDVIIGLMSGVHNTEEKEVAKFLSLHETNQRHKILRDMRKVREVKYKDILNDGNISIFDEDEGTISIFDESE